MDNEILKVPKQLKEVTLWVHPEGRVKGSLFLLEHSPNHAGSETPLEMLNQGEIFIVFKREQPEEIRFYNLRSLIRVEYNDDQGKSNDSITQIECHLQMMDGSFIRGNIQESLAPDRARLLDYLNQVGETFIKVHLENNLVYLINKSYIINVHVAGIDASDSE